MAVVGAGLYKLHHGSGELLDGSESKLWTDERSCLSGSCMTDVV